MKKAVRLICTPPIPAPRLWPMAGRAGRYMSMAKGPMAESRPSTRAILKKREVMPALSQARGGRLGCTTPGPRRLLPLGQELLQRATHLGQLHQPVAFLLAVAQRQDDDAAQAAFAQAQDRVQLGGVEALHRCAVH